MRPRVGSGPWEESRHAEAGGPRMPWVNPPVTAVGAGRGVGGTNPCDVGLDLSGSWQQGHSATYNAPSRI